MTDVLTLSIRVAEEVRVAMARKRVNQSELARRIGVSIPWVNDRLNGATEIKVNDLPRIATALGVTVISLMPQEVRDGQTIVGLLQPAEKVSGHTFRPPDNRPNGRPRTSSTNAVRRTSRLPRGASQRAA